VLDSPFLATRQFDQLMSRIHANSVTIDLYLRGRPATTLRENAAPHPRDSREARFVSWCRHIVLTDQFSNSEPVWRCPMTLRTSARAQPVEPAKGLRTF